MEKSKKGGKSRVMGKRFYLKKFVVDNDCDVTDFFEKFEEFCQEKHPVRKDRWVFELEDFLEGDASDYFDYATYGGYPDYYELKMRIIDWACRKRRGKNFKEGGKMQEVEKGFAILRQEKILCEEQVHKLKKLFEKEVEEKERLMEVNSELMGKLDNMEKCVVEMEKDHKDNIAKVEEQVRQKIGKEKLEMELNLKDVNECLKKAEEKFKVEMHREVDRRMTVEHENKELDKKLLLMTQEMSRIEREHKEDLAKLTKYVEPWEMISCKPEVPLENVTKDSGVYVCSAFEVSYDRDTVVQDNSDINNDHPRIGTRKRKKKKVKNQRGELEMCEVEEFSLIIDEKGEVENGNEIMCDILELNEKVNIETKVSMDEKLSNPKEFNDLKRNDCDVNRNFEKREKLQICNESEMEYERERRKASPRIPLESQNVTGLSGIFDADSLKVFIEKCIEKYLHKGAGHNGSALLQSKGNSWVIPINGYNRKDAVLDMCSFCKKYGHGYKNCWRRLKACYACGKIGHFCFECKSPESKCFGCGGFGHIEKNCTRLRKFERPYSV